MEKYHTLDNDTKNQINLMTQDGVQKAFIAQQLNIPVAAVSQFIQETKSLTIEENKNNTKRERTLSAGSTSENLSSNAAKKEKINNSRSSSRKTNTSHLQTQELRNMKGRKRKLEVEKDEERKKLGKRTRRSESLDKDLLIKFGIKRFLKVSLNRLRSTNGSYMEEGPSVRKIGREYQNNNKYNKHSDIKTSRETLSNQPNNNTTISKFQASKNTDHSPTVSKLNNDSSHTSRNRNCDRSKDGTNIENSKKSFEAQDERIKGNSLTTTNLREVKLKSDEFSSKTTENLRNFKNKSIFSSSSKGVDKPSETESLRSVRDKISTSESLRNIKMNEKFLHEERLAKAKSQPPTTVAESSKDVSDRSNIIRDINEKYKTKIIDNKDAKPIRVLSLKDFRETQTLTLSPKDFCDQKMADLQTKEPSLRDVKLTSIRKDSLLRGVLSKSFDYQKETTINSSPVADKNDDKSKINFISSEERREAKSLTEKSLTNKSSNVNTMDFINISVDENKEEEEDTSGNDGDSDPLCTEKTISNDEAIEVDCGIVINPNMVNDTLSNFENRDVSVPDAEDNSNKFLTKDDTKKIISSEENDTSNNVRNKRKEKANIRREVDSCITVLEQKDDSSSQSTPTKDGDSNITASDTDNDKIIKKKEKKGDETITEKESCPVTVSSKIVDNDCIATNSGKETNSCNSIISKEKHIIDSVADNDNIVTLKDSKSHKTVLNKDANNCKFISNFTDITGNKENISDNDTNTEISIINKDKDVSKSVENIAEKDASLVCDTDVDKNVTIPLDNDAVNTLTDTNNMRTVNKSPDINKNNILTDIVSDDDDDVSCFDNDNIVESSEDEDYVKFKAETRSKKEERENIKHQRCEKTKTEGSCHLNKDNREKIETNLMINKEFHKNDDKLDSRENDKMDSTTVKDITDFDKVHAGIGESDASADKCINLSTVTNDTSINRKGYKSVTFASEKNSGEKRPSEDTVENNKHFKKNNIKNSIPFMSKIEDIEFLRKNISNLKSTQNKQSDSSDDPRNRRRLKSKEERVEDCIYNCPKYSVLDTENLMHSYKNLVCGTCYKHVDVKFTSSMAVSDTEFQIRCGSCNHVKRFKRSRSCVSEVDFNVIGYDSLYLRLVFSCLDFGGGYSQLQSTCMALNIPQLNLKSFKKYRNYITSQSEIKLDTILKSAGQVVHQAHENVGVSANDVGVMEIKVLFDSSWIKSGKNDKYGLVVVVDVLTGLVLDYHLMMKYCTKCCLMKKRRPKSFELWRVKHRKLGHCQVNCESEQVFMERDGSIMLCRRSILKHKLKYKSISRTDFDRDQFSEMEEDKPVSRTEEREDQSYNLGKMKEVFLGDKSDGRVSGKLSEIECDNQLEGDISQGLTQKVQAPKIIVEQISNRVEDEINKASDAEFEKITDENMLDDPEINLKTRELTLSDVNNLASLSACENEVQELNEKSPNHVLEEINISLALDLGGIGAEEGGGGSESLNFDDGYLDSTGILNASEDPDEWLVGHSLEPNINDDEEEPMEIESQLGSLDSLETDSIFCNYNESELKIQNINTDVEQDSLILMEMEQDDNTAEDICEANSSFNKDMMTMNYDENREMASLLTSNVVDQEVTKDGERTPDTIKETAYIENCTQEGLERETAANQQCNNFWNEGGHTSEIIKIDKISNINETVNQGNVIDGTNLNIQNNQITEKDSSFCRDEKNNQGTEKCSSPDQHQKNLVIERDSRPDQDEQKNQKTEKQSGTELNLQINQKTVNDKLNLDENLQNNLKNLQKSELDKLKSGESSESQLVSPNVNEENNKLLKDNGLLVSGGMTEENMQVEKHQLTTPDLGQAGNSVSSPIQVTEIVSVEQTASLNKFVGQSLDKNEDETPCNDKGVREQDEINVEKGKGSNSPKEGENCLKKLVDNETERKNSTDGTKSEIETKTTTETVINLIEKTIAVPMEETVSNSTLETATNPMAETATNPVAESSINPMVDTATNSMAESSINSMAESSASSMTESSASSMTESSTNSIAETLPNPMAETAKNPMAETVTNSMAGTATNPIAESSRKSTQAGLSSSDKVNNVSFDKMEYETRNEDGERRKVLEALRKIKVETLRSNVLKNCNTSPTTSITKEMVEFACNYAIIAHNVNIESFMGKTNSFNIL